jgi:hypothetical protein
VRYRLMATYRGVPYEAGIGPTDGDVVLFAACPPPEELGFEPATGHWRKQLRVQDVQGLWESRPVGTFRGDRCIVLDDLGDRLHIAYLGHDAYQAEQLGYWQVDRGVFELVAPREEVSEIIEERLDYPRRAASRDPLAPTGAGASFPPEFRGASAPGAADSSPQAAITPPGPSEPQAAFTPPGPSEPQAAFTPPGPSEPQAAFTPSRAPDGRAQAAPRRDVPGTLSPPGISPADTQQDLAVIPPTSEPPLPLEAAALRAASARAGQQAPPQSTLLQPAPLQPAPLQPAQTQPAQTQPAQPQPAPPAQTQAPASHRSQAQADQPTQAQAQADQPTQAQAQPTQAAGPGAARAAPRRRRTALRRLATQRIFSELASLAAIPPSAYAVGEEVDGAMCLIHTPDGFEVFNAAAGSRHEVRLFDDEESAYFYLFGVLAAEAVRTGRLAPKD